ncbi:DUF1624 domain-containing protein [Rhizobium sp. CC1099]|uniref:DUF1624 domain-containing protein n=1 Tax=Rhizobium sp. CC1099 TaxID=3039160 RepID=UPI0024B157F5|nr:DUF1624 domain-containing protein [Rhizobium sp. CC1099]WFU89159.1 DUF1624 domain-containing protein [Rhizobium sp. CC1099]
MMAISANENGASSRPPRIGLLDTARGAALIAMATYHFTWDMEFMGYLARGTAEAGWLKIYARAIASTFLLLAGVSLVLSGTPSIRRQAYLRRLGMIVSAAALITAATAMAMPQGAIFFGILHSIAAASVIGLLFLRMPGIITIAAGIMAVIAPLYLRSSFFDTPWLWWVGLSQTVPRSNDYVPVLPWIGPFLIGMGVSSIALKQGWAEWLAKFGTGTTLLAKAGRHSLAIYLIHQPILISIAYALSITVPPAKPDPVQTYLQQCQSSCVVQEGEALCRSFCQCTLERLQGENLFTPLQSGAIQADKDERVQRIALECSTEAQ